VALKLEVELVDRFFLQQELVDKIIREKDADMVF
jgi:hypothetical protein